MPHIRVYGVRIYAIYIVWCDKTHLADFEKIVLTVKGLGCLRRLFTARVVKITL